MNKKKIYDFIVLKGLYLNNISQINIESVVWEKYKLFCERVVNENAHLDLIEASSLVAACLAQLLLYPQMDIPSAKL